MRNRKKIGNSRNGTEMESKWKSNERKKKNVFYGSSESRYTKSGPNWMNDSFWILQVTTQSLSTFYFIFMVGFCFVLLYFLFVLFFFFACLLIFWGGGGQQFQSQRNKRNFNVTISFKSWLFKKTMFFVFVF